MLIKLDKAWDKRNIKCIILVTGLISISTLASAGEEIVVVPGQVDCSDGHLSERCPGNNIGFPRETREDTGGGGSGGGGSSPRKRTPQQKATDVAKCEKEYEDESKIALNIFSESMKVCASKVSNWYGNLLERWFNLSPRLVGGHPQDCETINTQTYSSAIDAIKGRKSYCITNANRDQ